MARVKVVNTLAGLEKMIVAAKGRGECLHGKIHYEYSTVVCNDCGKTLREPTSLMEIYQ